MAKLHADENDPNLLYFFCPGCNEAHSFTVNGEVGSDGQTYTWNGDLTNPSITQEIVRNVTNGMCHFEITAAQIQFFADCWHSLKGQTVTLPDWQASEAPIYDK